MKFRLYKPGIPELTRERQALALLVLMLAGFFWFPGTTWLQSDTQIYVPIFEHLDDPGVLRNDLCAMRPHVSFTIYDEVTRALNRLTDMGYGPMLHFQQMAFRLVGLAGVFFIALSAGLPPAGGLFAAAAFGLGAVINGPAVLTFEYEPVPRGFAVMLIFGALGSMAQGWWRLSAGLLALATLYHPTTTAPMWGCAALWWLGPAGRRERWILLGAAAVAASLLALFASLQQGIVETAPLWGRIDPELEALQRMRGAYNWIGLWPREWLWQYPLLFVFAVVAWWRVRALLSPPMRFFALALPVYGLAMIPVTWYLLDVRKWVLMPQFQPARAVLFITAMAVLLGALAAWQAVDRRRYLEAGAWLMLVFAPPLNGLVLQLFTALPEPLAVRRVGLLLALAAVVAVLLSWSRRIPALVLVAIALPLILIPTAGEVRNYPELHNQPLFDLAAWARNWTERDAVFLFADAHRHLAPGIFRAEARRALYVDWKTGGQVNLLPELGREWGRRWKAVREARPPLLPLEHYAALGIDYLVVNPANVPEGATPVYNTEDYAVIRLP